MARCPVAHRKTLWDLAEIVWDEVERSWGRHEQSVRIADRILLRLVCRYVRNVEVMTRSDGRQAPCEEAPAPGRSIEDP
ncbi:MAG: hypothetical protein AB1640_02415 [bacterium]